jgi:phage terminase Nu1 subunit (DNA packaging protein)
LLEIDLTLFSMILLADANAICTGMQLSEVLGVSSRQIERLTVAGVLKPVRCKANGRRYSLSDSVQCYCAHQEQYITERVKGADDAYLSARADPMRCLAEREQLDLRLKKGELIRYDSALIIHSMILKNLRDNLRGLPAGLMHQLQGMTDAKLERVCIAWLLLSTVDSDEQTLSHAWSPAEPVERAFARISVARPGSGTTVRCGLVQRFE